MLRLSCGKTSDFGIVYRRRHLLSQIRLESLPKTNLRVQSDTNSTLVRQLTCLLNEIKGSVKFMNVETKCSLKELANLEL